MWPRSGKSPQQRERGSREEAYGEDSSAVLSFESRDALRKVAYDSIRSGLEEERALRPEPSAYPPPLRRPGAAFVTLTKDGRLRGCIGSLEAVRSVVEDVAVNAYGAAFRDHRFPALRPEELGQVEIKISLLSPMEPLPVPGRDDLLEVLRPGIDGLVLEDPPHRATFLPQVWDSLPQPEAFLEELMAKAGLPPHLWSGTIRFHRYRVEEF